MHSGAGAARAAGQDALFGRMLGWRYHYVRDTGATSLLLLYCYFTTALLLLYYGWCYHYVSDTGACYYYTPAYVSIRQHTLLVHASIRQHTSAYATSIRQQMSAYVSIRY